MDKQKMDKIKQQFPVVEAMLLTPVEGGEGEIGICTNTSATGQVVNEIPENLRPHISVLGSLIVSRDGCERMILNTLSHPTLKYLILFSEESLTFSPSTNLLQAIMEGFDKTRAGNYINGGVAASAHYPNINEKIFNLFKEEIVVIPAFMHRHDKASEIIKKYLEYLKPKVSLALLSLLTEINAKEKIYFDALNKILGLLAALPKAKKQAANLDPKEFQHLQPPKIELESLNVQFDVPFRVSKQGKNLRLDLHIYDYSLYLIGDDPFLIAFSLMQYLGEDKKVVSAIDQLVLGAELGRVQSEIVNGLEFPSFIAPNNIEGTLQVPLQPGTFLVMDKKYYYRVSTRGAKISVMCLAFDVCESVFELLATDISAIVEHIARENRFEEYKMDFLHRLDIGTQLGRAAIAAKLGFAFIQDFSAIFKINKETLPTVIVEGDSFLTVHKGILHNIYTKGITEEHGDSWKGLARSASVLAIYRDAPSALKEMPTLYRQGDQDAKTVRQKYKKELLRKDHDGTYTYGERTRSYFGFDQLEESIRRLRKTPDRAVLVQRFDPLRDMTCYTEPETGKKKFTHDPCLTHDIFFIQSGKLHTFHIVRAHNAVNAYPENIFGLFDAYTMNVVNNLKGVTVGDMYVLSNRANILLLTEEQRTKKILAEPSKPEGELNKTSGPYRLGKDTAPLQTVGGVAYFFDDMQTTEKTLHPILKRLQNYKGVDTVAKAIDYLKEKGVMHNNPILSEYYAGETDAQADQLAFFQANVFGGKVYATAVFMNRSIKNLAKDKELINYLGTRFASQLKANLGAINIYYVAYRI